jgi:hypothetical protein
MFDIARYHHYALPDIDCAGGIVGKKECVVSIVQIIRPGQTEFSFAAFSLREAFFSSLRSEKKGSLWEAAAFNTLTFYRFILSTSEPKIYIWDAGI